MGAPATLSGLSRAEVEERRLAGRTNRAPPDTARTLAQILRANVATRFNALLGALVAVVLVVGPLQDTVFGLVPLANTLIGVAQELRAKVTLERLAVLTSPRAQVLRDGVVDEIPGEDLVVDDVVALGPGDQLLVDGEVLWAAGLEVDESLITGESEPVTKDTADHLYSGSFVTAGTGGARATAVGPDAYAATLAAGARRFALVRSELQGGINRILRVVTWLMVPAGALLVWGQFATERTDLAAAVRGAVAGVAAMIPEGLVLLASVAFAMGALRLARRRVLVQELPALEGLARVDTLCLDKTGTLTDGTLSVRAVVPVGSADPFTVWTALASLGAADPRPNATMGGIVTACREVGPRWRAVSVLPFSSARRWGGAVFAEGGTWVLGAPDVLLAGDDPVRAMVAPRVAGGERVLVLCRSGTPLAGDPRPGDLSPAAVVSLGEALRPRAPETVRYLADQGVALKVLSGDHPATVAAVAREAGLAGTEGALDARDLPGDPGALADALEAATVVGRVPPQGKAAMVAALRGRGHVVAMTGDGVNDVLALKEADLGIAMGAGSPASRAVARVVLVDNDFAGFPPVLAEGRRVIANIERVASLFLTKTVYALVFAVVVGLAAMPYPFYPRHLTIVSGLTIGLPALVLALEPNAARAGGGFLAWVARRAVPAGLVAAGATLTA
ncbi:MAG TPA: HAD-IC family P-type ATPase, partial [Acidimicrobiales bacterium]|nr:HAD-IC family P-type ATPase [Acidimicrobiales bacterium]